MKDQPTVMNRGSSIECSTSYRVREDGLSTTDSASST